MEFIYSLILLSMRAWALLGRPRCLIETPSNSHEVLFFSPQLTVSDAGKEEKERDSTEAFRPDGAQRSSSRSDRGASLCKNARPGTKPHPLATLSRLTVALVLLILRELR